MYRLRDCFWMEHKIDVDEVVDHFDNGLPNLVNAEVFLYALDVTFKIPGVWSRLASGQCDLFT